MERYVYLGGLAVLLTSLGLTFPGFVAADPSVPVAYCASLNTASTSANYSTFQSEGLCYDFCNDDGYALGVLQSSNCWCSNYVPGDTVDTSECETACPGYPSDYCGGDDLYGYIKLDAAVSGTKEASSSTTTSTSTTSDTSVTTTSSSSSDLTTSTTTSLTSSEKSSESSEKTTSSTEQTTTSDPQTTSSSSSSSSDTPSVVTSVKTVTSDGQVVFQTITSTAAASGGSGKALSGGAIAGIVIGILAVLVAFIAGALIYRRHVRNRGFQEGAPLAGGMDGSHRRGSSVGIMSKAGTISSSGYGMPMEEDVYGSPRRMSMKPMDPRLDPKQTFGLYRAASHDSINTLRDDQDYSRRVHQPGRVLRVTNMGPTDE
ncbi:Cell wall integrity and stress response component 4 [Gnomoniopsis smithogilvyi]|uniref:Cell wall integrity and stress response component 4 n=1 Tax=Gnomoniopsis smithogilvyi TaxID=1191159 RepID=A0A9W9CT46_9PEZI|nr:Cell wall integrity and stress response component 4 [Gnomoniopsis smithogilvyi]